VYCSTYYLMIISLQSNWEAASSYHKSVTFLLHELNLWDIIKYSTLIYSYIDAQTCTAWTLVLFQLYFLYTTLKCVQFQYSINLHHWQNCVTNSQRSIPQITNAFILTWTVWFVDSTDFCHCSLRLLYRSDLNSLLQTKFSFKATFIFQSILMCIFT